MPKLLLPIAAVLAVGAATAGGATYLLTRDEAVEEAPPPAVQATATPAPAATEPPNATSIPEPTPTPTPDPTADWKTYTDPTYGYSFDYPASWHLSPAKSGGQLTALYSYDPTSVPPEEAGMPLPRDRLKVEIVVLDNPEGFSLEDWIQADRERGAPVSVSDRSTVAVDGTDGIRETVQSGTSGSILQHFFLKGTNVYVIVKYPSDSLLSNTFASILDSLRFTGAE